MKKNPGVVQAVYPMPVLIVAAYDENGKVNAMNAAWGMICNADRIALFIDEDHKTTQNLLKTKAFTVRKKSTEHSQRITSISTHPRRDLRSKRSGLIPRPEEQSSSLSILNQTKQWRRAVMHCST